MATTLTDRRCRAHVSSCDTKFPNRELRTAIEQTYNQSHSYSHQKHRALMIYTPSEQSDHGNNPLDVD